MRRREHTVVVADDDEAMRRLTELLLQQAGGYRLVGQATTGSETLEVVEREQPELLLLDVSMPDGDGYSVLEELRRRESLTQTVLITGFASEDQRKSALASGALDFMSKSTDTMEMVDRLRELHQRLSPNKRD